MAKIERTDNTMAKIERTDNTMAKIERTKEQTMKTPHRKILQVQRHESHKHSG
jgi:hypothetical protein